MNEKKKVFTPEENLVMYVGVWGCIWMLGAWSLMMITLSLAGVFG